MITSISQRLRRLGLPLAGLICALAFMSIVSPVDAAPAKGSSGKVRVPAEFFGVNYWLATEQLLKGEEEAVTRSSAAAAQMGANWIRGSILWRVVEQAPPVEGHTYDWSIYDKLVGTYARQGITFRPSILGAPRWAADVSLDSAKCLTQSGVPPRSEMFGDYAQFAAAVVERYGRNGEFWREAPEVPFKPVTEVEIWNEPNLGWWWCPGPNPEHFASLFVQAREAVGAVDSSVAVTVGGLAAVAGADSLPAATFLSRATAAEPRFAGAETVGVHLYSDGVAGNLAQLREFSGTMRASGMSSRVVVNEFGWPTRNSASGIPSLPEQERAIATGKLVKSLATARCPIVGVAPHTLVSREHDPSDGHEWFGLVDSVTGALHPTGLAYAQQASRLRDTGVSVKKPPLTCALGRGAA